MGDCLVATKQCELCGVPSIDCSHDRWKPEYHLAAKVARMYIENFPWDGYHLCGHVIDGNDRVSVEIKRDGTWEETKRENVFEWHQRMREKFSEMRDMADASGCTCREGFPRCHYCAAMRFA